MIRHLDQQAFSGLSVPAAAELQNGRNQWQLQRLQRLSLEYSELMWVILTIQSQVNAAEDKQTDKLPFSVEFRVGQDRSRVMFLQCLMASRLRTTFWSIVSCLKH